MSLLTLADLGQEHMKVSQSADSDLVQGVLQEPLHYRYKVVLGYFRAEDASELVDRVRECLFNAAVVELGKFDVDLTEDVPVILPKGVDKGREVE